MKRRKREVKRPAEQNKIARQGPLSSSNKRLPKWEIEGKFEDHPDADSDRYPKYRKNFKKSY
jgi:hypothetical protein